ncbi:MAG: histidinol-phosphate transaminase [Pseudomonadota bacterium]|nr:histidinol-phosphate transaminase [Pseudomonadota bacterium]
MRPKNNVNRPYIRNTLLESPDKFDPPTEGSLRHQGLNSNKILPMGLNECAFEPSPRIKQAILGNVDKIARYPDAQPPFLSDKIATLFEVQPDQVVWGNGSEELIKGVIDLSVSPGDGIILPVPTFWGYRAMVTAAEAEVEFVESRSNGKVNTDDMLAVLKKNTKLIFCITPNNPSGELLSQGLIEKLAKNIPDEVILAVDEAYFEFGQFIGGPNILSILKKRSGPWIVIRTFSKAYAMAGMRVGYAICSDSVLAQALKKTTCVFNVPILSIAAAEAALSDEEHLDYMMNKVVEGRTQFSQGLVKMGLSPLPSATNFVSVEVPLLGKELVRNMLLENIQIHAWPDPGYEYFVRITIGEQADNLYCLRILKKLLTSDSTASRN